MAWLSLLTVALALSAHALPQNPSGTVDSVQPIGFPSHTQTGEISHPTLLPNGTRPDDIVDFPNRPTRTRIPGVALPTGGYHGGFPGGHGGEHGGHDGHDGHGGHGGHDHGHGGHGDHGGQGNSTVIATPTTETTILPTILPTGKLGNRLPKRVNRSTFLTKKYFRPTAAPRAEE